MRKGKKNKKDKVSKPFISPLPRIPAIIFKAPEDRTRPTEQPKLIPLDTFQIISEVMLQTVPPYRNVFLSMCEYRIQDVNPMHRETSKSPTHMIIFCLRLIVSDEFLPIGVVQIDKRIDQTEKLVYVWKTFIEDLSILRLIVIGSISPPSGTFHKILRKLTKIPDMKDHTGPITYSVWPYKEIVHLYDYFYLLNETQDALFERNEICFISCPSSAKNECDVQLWIATWTDILLVLTSQGINCYYTSEDQNASPLAIFSPNFWNTYLQARNDGIIDTESKESTDRLMELFCSFIRLLHDPSKSFMCPYDLQMFYDNNEELRILLATAQFKKPIRPNSSKKSPKIIYEPTKDILNNHSVSIFDIFLQKVTYDDYDLFLRTSPKLDQPEASEKVNFDLHDHNHFKKKVTEKAPLKQAANSIIYNLVNNYFGEAIKEQTENCQKLKINETNCSKNISPQSEREKEFVTPHVSEAKGSKLCGSNIADFSITAKSVQNYSNYQLENALEPTISKTSNSDKSTTRKKTEASRNNKVLEKKETKIDQLHSPEVRRSKKIKAKRLRNKESIQKLISSLPLILTETSPERFSSMFFNVKEKEINKNIQRPSLQVKFTSSKKVAGAKVEISKEESSNIELVPEFSCSSAADISGSNKETLVNAQSSKKAEGYLLQDNYKLPDIKVQENSVHKDNVRSASNKKISKDLLNNAKKANELKDKVEEYSVSFCNSEKVKTAGVRKKALSSLETNIDRDERSSTCNLSCGIINDITVPNDRKAEAELEGTLDNVSDTLHIMNGEKLRLNASSKVAVAKENYGNKENISPNNLSQTILDLAAQNFSNIFVSYVETLNMSKNDTNNKFKDLNHSVHLETPSHDKNKFTFSVNQFDTKLNLDKKEVSDSDSTDSLTELLTSIEENPTKTPCKYMILKPKNMERTTNFSSEFLTSDTLYGLNHFESSLVGTTSDHLHSDADFQNFRDLNTPSDVATQDLFHHVMQKKSLDLSRPILESIEVVETLNMLDETIAKYSSVLTGASEHFIKSVEDQTTESDINSSPPLSNPDSLEGLEFKNSESLTNFVGNNALHENIGKMFSSTVNLKESNEDVKKPGKTESDTAATSVVEDSMSDRNKILLAEYIAMNNRNNENRLNDHNYCKTSDLMPCCRAPSTSGRSHSPSCEVGNQTFLPHYTRFSKFASDGSTSSYASVGSVCAKGDNLHTTAVKDNLDVTINNVSVDKFTGRLDLAMDKSDIGSEANGFTVNSKKVLKDYVSADKSSKLKLGMSIEFTEYCNNLENTASSDDSTSKGTSRHMQNDSDGISTSAHGVNTVLIQSYMGNSLNNSTVTNLLNFTMDMVPIDKSAEASELTVEKINTIREVNDFSSYYKCLKDNASVIESDDFEILDEYNPEEPNDYIEYKAYKKTFEVCDTQESKCDIIYRDRQMFEKLYNQIPEDFEALRLTTDWLCTFKGYIKLKDILVARKVRQFQASALSLEHLDFFVHIVKTGKNHIPSVYKGEKYSLLDNRAAFDVLNTGKGVYVIRNDNDVNNMSL